MEIGAWESNLVLFPYKYRNPLTSFSSSTGKSSPVRLFHLKSFSAPLSTVEAAVHREVEDRRRHRRRSRSLRVRLELQSSPSTSHRKILAEFCLWRILSRLSSSLFRRPVESPGKPNEDASPPSACSSSLFAVAFSVAALLVLVGAVLYNVIRTSPEDRAS